MAKYVDVDKLPVKQISIGGPMMPRFVSVVYADDIAAAPAAGVAPVVRGRWIVHEPFESGMHNCDKCIECSECNTWFGYDCYAKTNYCPNCGARMGKEEKQ